jgi:hypothetical protein
VSRARITVGEHWPVLSVVRSISVHDSDRTAYDVDVVMLRRYMEAVKRLRHAEADLLETMHSESGLIEPELLDYLKGLRDELR